LDSRLEPGTGTVVFSIAPRRQRRTGTLGRICWAMVAGTILIFRDSLLPRIGMEAWLRNIFYNETSLFFNFLLNPIFSLYNP
jgi:hypothetical protein